MTPDEIKAAFAGLQNAYDVLDGTGKHVEHTRKQIGRCVHCSCGARVQGRMAKK